MTPKSDRKEFSFAAGVAAYGMILRNSPFKGTADYDMAISLVEEGLENDPHGYRAEFKEMITTARSLESRE